MDINSRLKPGETFREMCWRHMDEDMCYICQKTVEDGSPTHGGTGAHWDCHEGLNSPKEERVSAIMNVVSYTENDKLTEIKVKPKFRKKRQPEGQGATAQKALKLGVDAVQKELGKELYDVRIWNQQGVYRGPQWDLDSWGFGFKFKNDLGTESTGYVSSIANMTQCVKYKKLKAQKEGIGYTYSLWESIDTQENTIFFPPVKNTPLIPPVKKVEPTKKSDNQRDKERKSDCISTENRKRD